MKRAGIGSKETMQKAKQLKMDMFQNAVVAVASSLLCRIIGLTILCIILGIQFDIKLALIVPIAAIAANYKFLIFEILLFDHGIEHALGYFEWYSCVDDNLYLGAIPLQQSFPHQLGIQAVMSILQPFEFNTATIVGTPVTPDHWRRIGVEHMTVESPDFYPPSFDSLNKGADFLNQNLSEGRKTYCHCKSGRGRSASIVMAYFMRYKKLDAISAFSKLKLKRSIIFDKNSSQMRNMIAYKEYLASQRSLAGL